METKNTGRCFSATEADNILFSRSLEGKWFGSVGLERSNGSIIGRVERSLSFVQISGSPLTREKKNRKNGWGEALVKRGSGFEYP